MDTEKRFILAFTLCIMVVMLHSAYLGKVRRQQPHVADKQTTSIVQPQNPQILAENTDISQPEPTLAEKTVPVYKEELITVDTGLHRAVLSNLGGGIKELYMTRYENKSIDPIQMSTAEKGDLLVLATESTKETEKNGPWTLLSHDANRVVYSREDAYTIATKTIIFANDNYNIGLELNIYNKGNRLDDVSYKVIGGQSIITDNQSDNMHAGVDVKVAGTISRKRASDKAIIGGKIFAGQPIWAAIRSRYFCFILQPNQIEQAAFMVSADGKRAWSGTITVPAVLEHGKALTYSYNLYAGPNSRDMIQKLGVAPKDILGYWVSSGIAQALLQGIKIPSKLFGNYGIGIIILTTIIGIVLFPLTRKTLDAAKKTQLLQPEIERIRKEYKDKPDKINKEMMELYKKHGVNPLGGCLPMLIQLPIFLSIFQILPRSIELRGAHFLWIKDLSNTDALFTFPQKLPIIGNNINLLPILMSAATVVQQKLSHPGGDVTEQQRMMSVIMPIMLCFIFYSMPACIVLYWLINTLTTLLIQEVVLKEKKQKSVVSL